MNNYWCKYKLSMIPRNTECMIITNRNVPFDPEISVADNVIMRKHCVRYLGLNVDDRLQFYNYVDYIKSSLSQFSGIAFWLKRFPNL